MKDLNLLVWLTQLGMGIAVPLGGFIWGAIWLRDRFELGNWVVVCGCVIGMICAVDGMVHSFLMLGSMMRERDKERKEPPVSYNDHD